MVLAFLFSGNANAGINEPGISFLSFQCKAGFDTEHYKIKKLVKKNQTVVLYGSCNDRSWSWSSNKGKNLKNVLTRLLYGCPKI